MPPEPRLARSGPVHGLRHGLVIQQHRTQYGLFSLDVLRGQARLREVNSRHGFHFDTRRR